MINVICQNNKIIYNAYHLVRAFFADAQVSSQVDENAVQKIKVEFDNKGFCSGEKEMAERQVETVQDIRELYIKLRDMTGRELPWGLLTGVRPTKLAAKWIKDNQELVLADASSAKEDFIKWFYDDRFVSRKKAGIAFDIALREMVIIGNIFDKNIVKDASMQHGESNSNLTETKIPKNSYSLYIGIPFCPSVCRYCSFSSGAISDYADRVDAYLDALLNELEKTAEKYGPQAAEGAKPTTIYIGGGTPTSLSAEQLDRLLTKVDELFVFPEYNGTKDNDNKLPANKQIGIKHQIKEYTVEAGRPDSITEEKLAVIRKHDVTRISINPQSMQQKTLDAIGRKHSVGQIREAFAAARALGFDNINMDLIMGLEGETLADVVDTLRQVKEIGPDSITVHSLAVKRASAIGMAEKAEVEAIKQNNRKSDQAGKAEIDCNESDYNKTDIAGMVDAAFMAAIDMGMNPYYLYRQKSIAGNFENIGYALPGKEGLYNILIMEEVQSIIACGAGASTKLVVEETENPKRHGQKTSLLRSENVKNIDEYIKRNK